MAEVWDQSQFYAYMLDARNWQFFVDTILPQVMRGDIVVTGAGDEGFSGIAEVVAATQARGSELGLTIPTSVLQAGQNATPPAPVATIPPPVAPADGTESIRQVLVAAGLGDLVDIVKSGVAQGLNFDAIMAQVRATTQWQTRFSGVVALQKKGIDVGANPEAGALAYEKQMGEMLRTYGLTGYTTQDYQAWYGNNVSVAEQSKKASVAEQWTYSETPEALSAAQRLWGITPGDITHYVLDPDHATAEIQRKLDAAQIAGSATQAGWADLNAQQASTIAGLASPASATAQIAKIAQQRQLYTATPGEGDNFSPDQIIQAYFGGNAQLLAALRQRNQQRDFTQASGDVLTSSKGALGAGTVQPS